jgi:hypothetical protein
MDKNILALILLFVFSSQLSAQIEVINKDKLDAGLLNRIHEFVYETFSDCHLGKIPKLNSKTATTNFLAAHKDSEKVKSYCEEVYEIFGSLINISLIEILTVKSNTFFRYKAEYEKIDRYTEIRVSINENGQYNSLILKPYWFDSFYRGDNNAPFRKVSFDSIETKYIDRATDLLKSVYNSCESSNFLKLTDEIATRRLINSLTDKKIIESCKTRNDDLGQLIDYELIEIMTDDQSRYIYRFKAEFSKLNYQFEIVVSTNLQSKLSGISERKWHKKFYDLNKEPKEEID